MESSTIVPSESTFNRLSYGRNRVRKKQPRTNPNYVNIEIKSNDGSFRSTYIRIPDVQKSKISSSTSSSSSSSSSTKHPPKEQNPIVCNAHFHSQPHLNEANEHLPNNDLSHNNNDRIIPIKPSSQWAKDNEERNEMILEQNRQHDHNQTDNTLTNKTALVMKQFVACKDGK